MTDTKCEGLTFDNVTSEDAGDSAVESQYQQMSCQQHWDGVQCWPPTPAGVNATLPCPAYISFDITKSVHRSCLQTGSWAPQTDEDVRLNYEVCFTAEARNLINMLGGRDTQLIKINIAKGTRVLELTGLTLSLLSLTLSLMIFFRLEALHNIRTRIHRCLFSSMLVHVSVRLVLYVDQLVVRRDFTASHGTGMTAGIETTPHICKSFYILLEYTRTAMFMWMFVEGFHLYYTVIAFRQEVRFLLYHLVGWGLPVTVTVIWAAYTGTTNPSNCWFAYNQSNHYWILEGPRIAIITVNFIFLLVVIRVLVRKLLYRPDQTIRDSQHIRKAVKAAIILLPLLGITNLLNMVPAPLTRTPTEFALWSFGSHFLASFQGFFVSLLYCFLNEEVQEALRRYFKDRFSVQIKRERRESNISSTKLAGSSADTAPVSIPMSNCNPLQQTDIEELEAIVPSMETVSV